jgi:hypothetical protein
MPAGRNSDGCLAKALAPPLGAAEREQALVEAWILVVMEDRRVHSRGTVKRPSGVVGPVFGGPRRQATHGKLP